MSLFKQDQFDKFAGKQAGVTFVDQWGSRVAKVGGKVFTLLHSPGNDDANIVFKVPEESFEILTAMDGIIQAPYFAKRQWVSVGQNADLPEGDLKTYMLRSYKIIAKSLTKKLRTELDIEVE
ncbi:MmcQ/YjbR family DNA-binding protein [Rhizobium sp. LjRoot254]|uniref:MmcQ/YjbR family DNA-binding protein n=1 Tax=Rhizobium sp. LjRoot254 TaxID=3342297 RepID=UPI003ECC31E3